MMKQEATQNILEIVRPAIYVVAVPIGNLYDLSPRGVAVLQQVDLIAAEDTRRAGSLLGRLGVGPKKMVSYFDHNEKQRAESIVLRIQQEDLAVAVISDGGTPCIADPGYRMVALAHERNIKVIPIPGPSALTTLVSASGLPSDRFMFVGFLPSKPNQRQAEIITWQNLNASIVFFEASRRLAESLQMVVETYPSCHLAVGRELCKTFEEIKVGHGKSVLEWAEGHSNLKGEVAVMVSLPNEAKSAEYIERQKKMIRSEVIEAFQAGRSHRDLMGEYADCGLSSKEIYSYLLELKNEILGKK